MNGAEAVVNFLMQKGVDVAFGYPGGPVLVLYEAIYKLKFNHILVRHEQGAAHAAEGYAKVTGRPGVIIATSGPGATNLVTGLADAMLDSVPLFAITGAVARKDTGRDAFQEADITGITEPITKASYLIMDEKKLLSIMEEAWQLTTEGRPGPVLINIPKDILALEMPSEQTPLRPFRRVETELKKSKDRIAEVISMLKAAKQPLLLIGGGCVISPEAPASLEAFLKQAPIPTAATTMGIGTLKRDHPACLGFAGMHGSLQANEALDQCDLLLAVGCRFSDRVVGNPKKYNSNTARKIIHCDIDPSEINKNVQVDLAIEDDAAHFFKALSAAFRKAEAEDKADLEEWLQVIRPWSDRLRETKAKMQQVITRDYFKPQVPLLPEYVLSEIAARYKGRDPIVVTDVGQHQMFTAQYFPIESPRSFLTSGGLGTMGFGLPASVGAAFAAEGRPVVAIVGDGGVQMVIQELGTIDANRLPIHIFIFDNATLGMVRQWQSLFFNEHYSQSELNNNPDFVKIAEAYKIPALNVETPEDLTQALDRMQATEGPFLCRVFIRTEENVYPMVPAGKNSDEVMMPGMDG